MKLSAHYNKASIIITVTVLVVAGVIYFFAINQLGRNQLDNDLNEEVEEVVDYINTNGKLPKQVDFDEDQTQFIKTTSPNVPLRFFDTVYNNAKEKRLEHGRAVSGVVKLNKQYYNFVITVSRQSTEYLIQIIGIITLALTVILLLTLTVTNKYILNGLWKPFHETLINIKAFNVAEGIKLPVKISKVDEFNELNSAVSTMSSRVKNDYLHLKHFTENASHEMLTPLAVITSKLDTLIQDEDLKRAQYEQINDIYAAASKLSRLNQSLLLLVKIENNLITDAEQLRLDTLIVQKSRQFQELIFDKSIILTETLQQKEVLASKYLMDTLLNNLYSNAIRHNYPGGSFEILLNDNHLVIKNSGIKLPLNPENLFKRFQKAQTSEGIGLGLTIVQNICSLYNWHISYRFENDKHIFEVKF